MTASAESRSEPPLGKAIVAYFLQENGKAPDQPEEFALIPGCGVYANIKGRNMFAGNEVFLKDNGISIQESFAKDIDDIKSTGYTIICYGRKQIVRIYSIIRHDKT